MPVIELINIPCSVPPPKTQGGPPLVLGGPAALQVRKSATPRITVFSSGFSKRFFTDLFVQMELADDVAWRVSASA